MSSPASSRSGTSSSSSLLGIAHAHALSLPPATISCLPLPGEEVTCLGFPTYGSDMCHHTNTANDHPRSSRGAAAVSHARPVFGRHRFGCYNSKNEVRRTVEPSVRRGIVAGFTADEEERHLLRMRVSCFYPSSSSIGREGLGERGPVVNGAGHVVGMIASSQVETNAGVCSVIPRPVIDRFLAMCADAAAANDDISVDHRAAQPRVARAMVASASAICSHTDTSRDTGDEASGGGGSHRKRRHPADAARKGGGDDHDGWNRSKNGMADIATTLPGVPDLGITGFQTLENMALRRSLGLAGRVGGNNSVDDFDFTDCGVRILGVVHRCHHATAMASNNVDNNNGGGGCSSKCRSKSCNKEELPRADDVLLAVDGRPVRLDGTVPLSRGHEHGSRVDFRWLVSQKIARVHGGDGSTRKGKDGDDDVIEVGVLRGGKRVRLRVPLSAPRHLVPTEDEGEPSYVICGGCVFVPLSRAWLSERFGIGEGPRGFDRYLRERRKGDEQIIVLSHVLADDVNVGYHGMGGDLVLNSVGGRRPIDNMSALVDMLVKRDGGDTLEFKFANVDLDRARVVICMDAREVNDSETRIMRNYAVDAWCSNGLSPALKREAEGKAHRHGVTGGLMTMRALRNAVRETTLINVVQQRPSALSSSSSTAYVDDNNAVVKTTRRIMDFSEAHKMQSAPLFAGKWTEEGGWTQVKTKHLSQLCICGKSTRFYCICSVGVMRCKDCFIKHCRDHSDGHECSEKCPPSCEGPTKALIAEGVELVTTKKRKKNNPTQAIQSRCVVCKAKTCYCCSACGFEKEVALCHVSTGRNCLPLHTSEHHSGSDSKQESKCAHDHN
mmetsp:Transcript_1107/g.2688  ORF Transcript_1107/g.2688 Transcript_1107/m.2688 type:complete len:838 (+) Transcript_1107:802-3315(+)